MAYGAAVIPLAYAFAFGFSSHSAAQVIRCVSRLGGPWRIACDLRRTAASTFATDFITVTFTGVTRASAACRSQEVTLVGG